MKFNHVVFITLLCVLCLFILPSLGAKTKNTKKTLASQLICTSCQHVVTQMKSKQDLLPRTDLSSRHRLDERASSKKIPFHRSEQALYDIFEKVTDKNDARNYAVMTHTIQPSIVPKDSDHRATHNDSNTKAIKYAFAEVAAYDSEFVTLFQIDREDKEDPNDVREQLNGMITNICITQLNLCETLDYGDVIYVPPPPPPEPEPEKSNEDNDAITTTEVNNTTNDDSTQQQDTTDQQQEQQEQQHESNEEQIQTTTKDEL